MKRQPVKIDDTPKREHLVRFLLNDQRNESARRGLKQGYDVSTIADRFSLLIPETEWDLAAQVLKAELSRDESQRLVCLLEARAQSAARQARYLYGRIGVTDIGHKSAAREQNTTGRKLHQAFGYDSRSCPKLAL